MSQEGYTVEKRHVSDISPDEFEREYIRRGIPLVLQGSLDQWEAYKKWNLDFFYRIYGETEVQVDMGSHSGNKHNMKISEYIDSFDDYVRDHEENGAPVPYLRVWNFQDNHPELETQFDTSKYFEDHFERLDKAVRPPFCWLFMGPKGIHSALHVDIWYTDAWLCMLQGSKKFTVYHPSHRKYLEVGESWVNLEQPDLNKFPDFPKAIPVEFVLEEGEMLYIPRNWPHAAVSLEPSLALSANFLTQCNKKKVMPTLTKYLERRSKCEQLLQRSLRGSDNLMKFCCHGGRIPIQAAKMIMGKAFMHLLRDEYRNASDSEDSSEEDEKEIKEKEKASKSEYQEVEETMNMSTIVDAVSETVKVNWITELKTLAPNANGKASSASSGSLSRASSDGEKPWLKYQRDLIAKVGSSSGSLDGISSA